MNMQQPKLSCFYQMVQCNSSHSDPEINNQGLKQSSNPDTEQCYLI